MERRHINKHHPILVLGAYGLAGRAIVERLAAQTSYSIIAAGRNAEKLNRVTDSLGSDRIQTLALDVTDTPALKAACAGASFVINAVGPFSRTGAAIAHTVIEAGCPYLDCANEQRHYHNLKELNVLARQQGVPMITAAGAIPGISTLLTAHLLQGFPDATDVTCCWAQFRHAYAESGLASMMGGILEAMEQPQMVHNGTLESLVIGHSIQHFELQEPFGKLRLMELPTIDTLTLSDRFSLQELHTWFYLGDMPTWLLGIIRLLRPDRRVWAYKLVETIMRHLNDKDTAKAIASGVGPECLLTITARNEKDEKNSFMVFRDGAVATACLPVHIADAFLQGKLSETGLLTPLDIVKTENLLALAGEVLIESDLNQ